MAQGRTGQQVNRFDMSDKEKTPTDFGLFELTPGRWQLNEAHKDIAVEVFSLRQRLAKLNNLPQPNGMTTKDPEKLCAEGVYAELLAARWLEFMGYGTNWNALFLYPKQHCSDLGDRTQVRWTPLEYGSCIVRESDMRDHPGHFFMLLVGRPQDGIRIVGGKALSLTKKSPHWCPHGRGTDRRPAWFVPQDCLNHIGPKNEIS